MSKVQIKAEKYEAEKEARELIKNGGTTDRWEVLEKVFLLLRDELSDKREDVEVIAERKSRTVSYDYQKLASAILQKLEIRGEKADDE